MSVGEFASRSYMLGTYMPYQEKYAQEPKEADKVMIGLARLIVADRPLHLLDIGCSNGNLLRHLKREIPALRLTGAELFPEMVDQCRGDPTLSGVDFAVMDVRDLPAGPTFDIVVTNALLGRFSPMCSSGAVLVSLAFSSPVAHSLRSTGITPLSKT